MLSLKIKKVTLNEKGEIIQSPKLPDDLPRKAPKDFRITKVTLNPTRRTKRSEQATNGHWQFDKPMCQSNEFGFIYLIHDTINNRMYIGKKQYLGAGKLNRGQETNWKWYTSSCTALQLAIKANNKEDFKFYVLEEYRVRGTLGYAETWSLMFAETPANRDKWYNMLVNKISWNVKEGISDKHKRRLSSLIAGHPEELEVYVEKMD